MTQAPAQPLEYASPPARPAVRRNFRRVAVGFALAGAFANVAFIGLAVAGLHQAQWAYADLMRNPKAYGRLIAPAFIATLREPIPLWLSTAAFMVSAAFGLLLAIHLLLGAVGLKRDPSRALRRLEQYVLWKWAGTAATSLTFFWSGLESWKFWATATAHVSIGSGPAYLETVVFAACALLPVWWVRTALRNGLAAQVMPVQEAVAPARSGP